MLKIILILEALCHGPQATAPTCQVRWATHQNGDQTVLIAGHHKRDVVMCVINNVAGADCVLLGPAVVDPEDHRDQDDT